MRRTFVLATIIALGLSALLLQSPGTIGQGVETRPPLKLIAIRAGRMVDGRSATPANDVVILIEGERIKAVGPGLEIPSGAEVIDLSNATVLPGLIDCHTHLLTNFNGALDEADNSVLEVARNSPAYRALRGSALGREDLESGITTVRDLGNSGLNGDVALRDAINAGWVVGPRLIVSTRALSATGGQFPTLAPAGQKIIDEEYQVINGVEEARRAVRHALYDGADCIKVIVNTDARILSLDEMKVIVEEAHRANRKVAAHAVGELPSRIAAAAGVDSIEHGYILSDEVLRIMAEKKIFLVPTDAPIETYVEVFSRSRNEQELKQFEAQVKMFIVRSRDRLRRAVKAGVRIAAGSDMYYQLPGKTRGEASLKMFRAYAESGMPSLEIIRAATSNAAELLGYQNLIGAVEPRKFADLIAVEGDPLKDITELERVKFVMKAGRIIKNDLKPGLSR